jgi:hypothetical protein
VNAWLIIVIVVALLLFGLYLSMTAGRLDRLHKRLDTTELSLESHLLRRSSVAIELAMSGLLDPAGAMVLTDTAHTARQAADVESFSAARSRAESELSQALLATLDVEEVGEIRANPAGVELLDELAAAARRVQLSRRFLNDAVQATIQVRNRKMVRWFRLAGHTPWPETIDLDDRVPPALALSD